MEFTSQLTEFHWIISRGCVRELCDYVIYKTYSLHAQNLQLNELLLVVESVRLPNQDTQLLQN